MCLLGGARGSDGWDLQKRRALPALRALCPHVGAVKPLLMQGGNEAFWILLAFFHGTWLLQCF